MVQILNEPKFPVIDEAPGTKEIINGFRPVDWRNLALVTVLTMPLGYAAGTFSSLFYLHIIISL